MSEVSTRIQDFAHRYDQNRYITSCRIAAYRHNFRQFTDVEIAEFSDEQIENFIRNWFSNQPEWGQRCWEQLSTRGYETTKELAHTPLLLTLVCLLFQRAGQFPTNRATLYERALRALLEEWDAEKSVPREAPYRGLDTKRKELLLQEIAYDAFERNELFLQKRTISAQIEALLRDMLTDESYIDGEAVLRSIEVQHGVLVERSEGIYSFSHLTLQEFLTTQMVGENPTQIKRLVTEHLTDDRWREVFLLMAGLQRSTVLLEMEAQTQTYINTPNLKKLLRWAEQATAGSSGDYKSAAKRVMAIFLARALDRARARARALDLAREYAKVEIFTNVNFQV